MEKEYESLRQEILQWQTRRFDIMAGSTVVVTAILGWIVNSPDAWSWAVASLLPLSFLSSASFLACLFNRSIATIGTYLEVFHASAWNIRLRKFIGRRRITILSLTNGFVLTFLGLGIISIILPSVVCKKQATTGEIILFFFICLVFFVMLGVLILFSYPREIFISAWQEIKDQETLKVPE